MYVHMHNYVHCTMYIYTGTHYYTLYIYTHTHTSSSLQDRIMKHKYRNLADMEDDMMLLCQNARKFNEEGSQIYTDSLELENAYLESRAQIDSGLLDFGESGDEAPTPSSSQTSSVHVVEMDCYLSDNSDGKAIIICNLCNLLAVKTL